MTPPGLQCDVCCDLLSATCGHVILHHLDMRAQHSTGFICHSRTLAIPQLLTIKDATGAEELHMRLAVQSTCVLDYHDVHGEE